jgi:2-C-methyl-D-erythritol 2,4-cyclodiphosphate synthase
MNKPQFRTGHGFDLHVFADDRELILGGVKIPHERGLLGHSDADCVIHALSDSLLGAMALPDIGIFFPMMIQQIKIWTRPLSCNGQSVKSKNLAIVALTVDITIIAQKPKLGSLHSGNERRFLLGYSRLTLPVWG